MAAPAPCGPGARPKKDVRAVGNMAVVVKAVCGSHSGVGAPPILVYLSGDWDVHWNYGILTRATWWGPLAWRALVRQFVVSSRKTLS